MKTIFLLALAFGAGYVIGSGGDMNRKTYQPVFYPSAPDLLVHERGPTFRTEAGARAWIEAKMQDHEYFRSLGYGEVTRTLSVEPDHEIGVNCHALGETAGADLAVCEETID